MDNTSRKRKYVDSHVQGALLKRVIFHWIMFFFVTVGIFAGMNALSGDPALPLTQRFWGDSNSLLMVAILMIGLLPPFVLDTVRFSNRFVGPITRLRRSLRELGENGTTEPIAFREDDFWGEMAQEFNCVLERVKAANNQQQPSQPEQTVDKAEA